MRRRTTLVTLIEEWFAKADGDGEFCKRARDVPFSVVGPATSTGSIIYTSKPNAVLTGLDHSLPDRLGLVGRYGLPDKTDIHWLRRLAGSREVLFLGDMDPVDLMVFAWLRVRWRPKRLRYLGIGDSFLADLEVRLLDTLTIPLAASEKRAYGDLATLLPDLDELIGTNCVMLLTQDRKIELEGVLHGNGATPHAIVQAICGNLDSP